jgi:type VI secretion system secreted protein Hcp
VGRGTRVRPEGLNPKQQEEFPKAIYMKYGSIKGDTTEDGHIGWISLDSFQWGVGRGISTPTGNSHNRESSAPSVGEITAAKTTDAATVALLTESLHGEGKDVTIDFCKTEKDKLRVYLTYHLSNAMVSGYAANSGHDVPTETFSLNFTKVACKVWPMDSKGDRGTPRP